MVDSPASERPGTPVVVNLESLRRLRSVAQQSADTASTQTESDPENLPQIFEELPRVTIITISFYCGGQPIVRRTLFYQEWR